MWIGFGAKNMDGYIIPGRFFQNGCFVSVLPREAYKVEGMLVLYWINFRYFCRSTKKCHCREKINQIYCYGFSTGIGFNIV